MTGHLKRLRIPAICGVSLLGQLQFSASLRCIELTTAYANRLEKVSLRSWGESTAIPVTQLRKTIRVKVLQSVAGGNPAGICVHERVFAAYDCLLFFFPTGLSASTVCVGG